MNIQTNAVVGNQYDRNEITEFEYRDHRIKWMSFNERGVGLNRNNTLMRANADIVMFADDDMVFVDNYETIVKEAFEKIPQADVIIFDLIYSGKVRRPITKIKRLSAKACMRFGTARISAKLNSLKIYGISFNLLFGGGSPFSCGEDSLFLMDCIRKKLKIYSYPVVIAKMRDRDSTWFKGHNDKFFFDKGILFSLLFPRLCSPCALVHCYKHRKEYAEYGWWNAYRQMQKGIRFRKRNL
jgi:hypothetical protein